MPKPRTVDTGDERLKEYAWVVWINTDLTEGRGAELPRHVCRLEATARRLASRAGVQGSDARVTREKVGLLPMNGYGNTYYGPVALTEPTPEDTAEETRIERRQAALEKARAAGLTNEDLAALAGGTA